MFLFVGAFTEVEKIKNEDFSVMGCVGAEVDERLGRVCELVGPVGEVIKNSFNGEAS